MKRTQRRVEEYGVNKWVKLKSRCFFWRLQSDGALAQSTDAVLITVMHVSIFWATVQSVSRNAQQCYHVITFSVTEGDIPQYITNNPQTTTESSPAVLQYSETWGL